jgi:isopenicillin-N epimerase
MRDGFLLDPDVVHLNHGSFGACPVPVFEEYQRLQRELETGPTDFFTRKVAKWFWGEAERPGRMLEARASLAAYLGVRTEDLVFVPNATSGLNAVIRSLRLEPGDEVVTTAHEYGAITMTWEFAGATLVV